MATTTDGINWITVHGIKYCVNLRHRDNSHGSTKWCVCERIEVEVFELATTRKWGDDSLKWGFYFGGKSQEIDANFEIIGKSGEYIAKYRTVGATPWHGYPARPGERRHDLPPDEVLQNWFESGCLKRSRKRKLLLGHWQLWN